MLVTNIISPDHEFLNVQDSKPFLERAFLTPKLFDNNSIEQWHADRSKEITLRALE